MSTICGEIKMYIKNHDSKISITSTNFGYHYMNDYGIMRDENVNNTTAAKTKIKTSCLDISAGQVVIP